jgi:hypothetical protein
LKIALASERINCKLISGFGGTLKDGLCTKPQRGEISVAVGATHRNEVAFLNPEKMKLKLLQRL